jgi:predicted amidophosphoribosyltransferase
MAKDQIPAYIENALQECENFTHRMNPRPERSRSRDEEPEAEPGEDFAFEQGELGHVAVFRPRICQRNGVFFTCARSWFGPAKLHGIQIMKASKDAVDQDVAGMMAVDLVQTIEKCHAAAAGALFTAPSPRHSARLGVKHFATLIAEKVAERLESPCKPLFESIPTKHLGHHPAREKEPPKLILENLPESKRIVLVDDVATSGKTLEIHANLLAEAGMKVTCLVWVYGVTGGVGR